ncbi:hypothetical protein D082_19130 [Synechocystis sp. PCC 6714]|nr:hypothetical protein D082_19130 [Synechocystis sp. PCC 6714]
MPFPLILPRHGIMTSVSAGTDNCPKFARSRHWQKNGKNGDRPLLYLENPYWVW